MVEHGFGVSLLLFWVVREEIEKGEFNQIKITGHKLCRTVAMVSLKGAKSVPIRTLYCAHILEQKSRLQKLAVSEK